MNGRGRWILAMGAVALLALGLRLYRVDWQSAWYDEIFTLYACGQSVADMTTTILAGDINPPLHYYFLHGWFQLLGYGALEGRLMSVLFGVLAVLFTGLLGRELFGEQVGILAALLLAVSTMGVMYSQEVRAYAQLLAFSTATSYAFVRVVREPGVGRWLVFVLCAVGTVYTHYYGSFIVLFLVGFAWTFRREYPIPLKWWIGGVALGLLLFAPWISTGVVELLRQDRRFAGAAASVEVKWFSLISAVNWFNNGKWLGVNARTPVWLLGVGGVLFSLPAVWGSREVLGIRAGGSAAARARWMLLINGLWLVPLILIMGASWIGGVRFNFRYYAYLVAPYSLVVAKGISDIHPGLLRNAWLCLVLAHSVIGLRAVYYVPYKEDYRASANLVSEQQQPGDCSVFLPSRVWGDNPRFWHVYHPDHEPPDVRAAGQATANSGCNRIWLVWDRTWWLNRDTESTETAILDVERSSELVSRTEFFSSEVRLYVPYTE